MSNNNAAEGFSLKEWAESNPDQFDRSEEYKQHVEPIIFALREACKKHGLPLQYMVVHSQDSNGNNVVAHGMQLTTMREATGEIMAASSMACGKLQDAMSICSADMTRTLRLQPDFPASISVH